MKMNIDFVSGYAAAVANLGHEGDHRQADWSAPYGYLKGRLDTFEPISEDIVEQLRYRARMCESAAAEIERLRQALSQCKDRANSLQNKDDYGECIRQLACIDHIARGALPKTA